LSPVFAGDSRGAWEIEGRGRVKGGRNLTKGDGASKRRSQTGRKGKIREDAKGSGGSGAASKVSHLVPTIKDCRGTLPDQGERGMGTRSGKGGGGRGGSKWGVLPGQQKGVQQRGVSLGTVREDGKQPKEEVKQGVLGSSS